MNIKHEMQKACLVAYREGVLYGAIWKTSSSWHIQRIDPDICELSSIEDGTWLYSVDMSKIKKEDLVKYPPEFAAMYEESRVSNQNRQEVPSEISFCLKADETTQYSVPPFASALPSIYDLETYRELAEISTEIDNYKLLSMKVPTKDGELTMDWDLIMEFYDHLVSALPPNIGAAAIPMELDTVNFEKSGVAQRTDELEQATKNFWYSSGSSPLLFGDASNTSSGALTLSIRTDEELVFATIEQCQRLINRHLRSLGGSLKFKVTILPVTIFNQEKMIGYYKEAATYGLPVKQAYAAAVGIHSDDIPGTCFLENEVLGLADLFVPLSSSHTQSGKAPGAPSKSVEDISDSGGQSRDEGSDGNKEGNL
ncbi:MAG: hypothetical protein RR365_01045 [Bacteroides sp.]